MAHARVTILYPRAEPTKRSIEESDVPYTNSSVIDQHVTINGTKRRNIMLYTESDAVTEMQN